MNYFIIAGEASGDLHGAKLIERLHQLDPKANIQAWGGEKMQKAGASILQDYRDIDYMGFVEIIRHLPKIFKLISKCKNQIKQYKPDVLIFIDYPGFNLRIARWAKSKNYTTVYYIAPQLWAWHKSRMKHLVRSIDRLLVILPFEKNFFQAHIPDVHYVGHPLVEEFEASRSQTSVDNKEYIALMPGSRTKEIERLLPIMLEASCAYPEYRFIVAKAPNLNIELYQKHIAAINPSVTVAQSGTANVLRHAKAAIVTSGTATLETALHQVPQCVVYKGDPISYHIAKRLVKVPHISLVNLIANKKIVTELLQNDVHVKNLENQIALLMDSKTRAQILNGYARIRLQLGNKVASKEAAQKIMQLLHINS